MKKLHTYTRILLSLLLMLVTNVVMGQEVNIPIRTISADPATMTKTTNHSEQGHNDRGVAHQSHAIESIIDRKSETTWIADQEKEYKMLNYLQLTDVDKTGASRSWIELPYVPNQNTAVEVTFENSNAVFDNNKTQYIFGCGNPGSGSGMAMRINPNGIMVNLTSNKTYVDGRNERLKSKLTYILSIAGIQQGDGDANQAMLYGFDSGDDVINESTDPAKIKNLCFFDNPGDENSMTYAGRIYSVKIRENGMLRFDLQPATYNGTPGFYDRISTDFYALISTVPYIENTTTDVNLHVKVPLSPTAQNGYEWSSSLVKNGYLVTDDLGAFQKGESKTTVQGKTTLDDGVTALQVRSGQRGSEDWDSQLFIVLDEPILPNEVYYISFDYKTAAGVTTNVGVQAHSKPGSYNNNFLGGSIMFTPEWQHGSWTGTVSADEGKNGGLGAIAFNLNVKADPTDYYITNVVVKKQKPTMPAASGGKRWSDNLVYNGMLEDDNMSAFSQNRCKLAIDSNQLTVVSSAKENNDNPAWYSQFFIKLSEKVLPNEIVYISFDYKAKEETTAYTQSFQNGKGSNSDLLGTLNFSTNWKTYSNKLTISANQGQNGGLEYIAFNLNDKATSNNFYFRNIVIRKETTLDLGKKWSDNLFSDYDNASGNKTNINIDGRAYVVTNSEVGGNAWASPFRVIFGDTFKNNDKYYISFSYSASKDANVNTYLQGDGGIQSNNTPLQFTKDTWKSQVWEGVIGAAPHAVTLTDDQVVKYLTFHLNATTNQQDETTTYRFRDIVIRKQVDADPVPTEPTPDAGYKWANSLVKNGSFSTNDVSSYSFYPNSGDNATTYSLVDGPNGAKAIQVVSQPERQGYWESNFTLKLNEPINKGETFYISFDYKATNRDNASLSQAYDKVGNAGAVENSRTILENKATGEWQTYTKKIEYAFDDATDKIVLYLNGDNTPTTFSFANIVVKKMIPDDEKPASELTIKFKNLNTNKGESYSVRHLFSLGTHEEEVMALNTRYGKYNFVSGGILTETGIEIDVNEPTATFKAGEYDIDGTSHTVTGAAWSGFDALYLMGTHCGPVVSHNGYAPRSFVGQIYSATLTENGIKRFDLIPAINSDGEYGFIDKLTFTFYGKDGCAPEAKLTGPESGGYDTDAVKADDFKMPFKIDFTTDRHVAASMTLTTAGREDGENQEPYNNPSRIVLYGSNDGNLWQRLNLNTGTGDLDGKVELPGKKEDNKLLSDTYNFGILGNTNAFTRYRLIVENVRDANTTKINDVNVRTHSCLRLADVSFSVKYSFEHYHGRVYDSSNIPEDLEYASEWKTSSDDSRLGKDVTLQRTHEYEHVIYVWPGGTVNLTPFSDFADNTWPGFCYREQYIRWYDYQTDTRSTNLSFDAFDDRNMNVLDEGHFAWNLRDNGRRTREGAVAKYTAPNTTDEIFGVIAIEAAMDFDLSERSTWDSDKNAYVIKEPTVQWRHTFVIKNAQKRADNMTQYIEDNKITLMCPAGTPFQYPLPSFEYANSKTGHPTDFYTTNGTAIEHYLIETTDKNGNKNSTYLEFDTEGKAVSDGNKNTAIVYTNGGLSNDQTAYSYKAKDGYNRVFYMLDPQEGTYIIKIFALNPADNTAGMQLMEYKLQVLPPTEGNKLLTRKELEDLVEKDPEYEKQLPSVMDKLYVAPTAYVNFDDVNDDEVETVLRSNLHKPVVLNSDQEAGGEYHYYKWPWQWENSSYGFGYEDRGDYNMYMVADHMAVTPNRGIEDDGTDDLTKSDVFDVSYYEKGKKGYFFYANAASDPSRMAVLNIGQDFCPNTKVFVSAWVNEVQHKNLYAETANVIFSFRGVRADGTEKLLNSYVTGYVTGGWNTPSGYIAKTAENETDGVHHRDGKDLDPLDSSKKLVNPEHRGDWMHVYYTFSTTHTEDFDHYIITLENNCTSSEGADYAIDDIRAYVLKPNLQARLMEPVCNGDVGSKLEIYGGFEQLQTAFVFNDEDITLKYCFLDKEVFDEIYGTHDLTASDFKPWTAPDATGTINGTTGCTYELGTSTGMPYGDGNVCYLNYADLSNASKLIITATEGTPRLLFNRIEDNGYVGYEYPRDEGKSYTTKETKDGVTTYTVDITKLVAEYGFAHLHAIKGAYWANTTVTSIQYRVHGTTGTAEQANQAYNESLQKGVYGGAPTDEFGTLTLKSTYANNISYDTYEGFKPTTATPAYSNFYKGHYQEAGNIIVFPCKATDVMIQPGKSYYLAVAKDGLAFEISGKCSKMSEFTIPNPLTVKIDGHAQSSQGGDSFCANQRPEVTIDLNGVMMGGKPVTQELLKFDWYYGPMSLGTEQTSQGYTRSYSTEQTIIGETTYKLDDVLGNFRAQNPTADNDMVLGVKEGDNNGLRADEPLTNSMLLFLKGLVEEGRLTLYKDRAFAAANLFGENLDPAKQQYFYLTAVPINPEEVVLAEHPEYEEVKFCIDPINVRIKIDELTPMMKDGAEGIAYPMNDVPLRIGLKQLQRTVIGSLSGNTVEQLKDSSPEKQLWLPLRAIAPVTEDGKEAGTTLIKSDDDMIYLVDSNDPQVKIDGAGAILVEEAASLLKGAMIAGQSYVVGKLMAISAVKGGSSNVCQMAFLKSFKFREGYWYTVKFHFKQKDASSLVCPGDLVFTIKVVPEYQMWTGAVSRNWNDDRNWTRVTKEDLLWDDSRKTANVDYITDGGTNDNVESFAPADFTKVIIPAGVKHVPYMYDVRTGNSSVTYVGALRGGLQIANADPTNEMVIGKPTENVIYDMASVNRSDNDVACRPWYDHTCDQIHFNSGAAMMDQRYLYYNKAWCDIEVPVGTWQTVASPLMNIVAGDLYLPTASARQDTPLFEDINYDPDLNDRFAPAVFQRSWNKSMAKVYELGGDQPRNVGIKLDWSHVYNDVNVRYGAGQGFSIKVDVSSDLVTNKPATAKFRFPKADKQYTYYNPNDDDGTSAGYNRRDEPVNGSDIVGDVRPGRLADLTTATFQEVVGDNSNAATATSYFLVGNPLMCWLNMQKFFAENSQFEPKYWTVTADGQQTALFSEERGWVSTSEDPKFLPPGVSFFVHLKQNQDGQAGASTTVAPDFKSSMMSYTQAEPRTDGSGSEDESGNPTNDPAAGGNNNNNQQYNEDGSSNNAKTRSANSTMPQLHMTATDVNGRQSRALLMDGTMIEHEGVETLFDSNLKDDALLYTTKDGMAKTIASIAPGDTLPLAVSGARDEVQLSIEGVKDFDFDLFLIDSEEGTVEPLEGDIVLKQAASGVRYYIATRSKDDTEVEGDVNVPRVTAKDGYITVYAPAACEIETSAIYNTGGIRLDYAEHIAESHSVKLLPGIYIVHLLCDGKTYTYKLMLR